MSYHELLQKQEAARLEQQGYRVFLEYEIANCRVDVIGFKENGAVIVECGWLTNLSKIKNCTQGIKIISVPSLKCFLPTTPYDPEVEEPREPLYAKYLDRE
ncbi:MAG: hypothetical protein ABSF44_03645 [Candidatus Bathyarchaeia archaeon]|jgi:hypothetical protein